MDHEIFFKITYDDYASFGCSVLNISAVNRIKIFKVI